MNHRAKRAGLGVASGNVLYCAVFAAVGAIEAGQASASEFYGVTTSGVLTRFDMSAHTVTTLGGIHVGATSLTGFEDLDFDAAGNLYALRNFVSGGLPPSTFNEVYRFTDPSNAAALLSANLGGSNPLINLGYNAANSSFYSVNGVNGYLGTVGVTSGAFTPVTGVSSGWPNTYALAVNPVTGLTYGITNIGAPPPFGSLNYALISINLTTGLSTVIGSLGVGQDQFRSLRFDDAGVAYTVDSNNGNVYTVNTSTGAATFLFAGGAAAADTSGLAFIAVPAPGAGGLLGVVAVCCHRRRRR